MHKKMKQRAAFIAVRTQLKKVLDCGESGAHQFPEAMLQELKSAGQLLTQVIEDTLDYETILENLDENVLVTDKDEVVLYVNNAYVKNTGIEREQILGKKISDILKGGELFTAPVTPDVIRTKKRVMRLSSMFKQPDLLGFVTGVPVFDETGEIRYVIANNRAVSSFRELHGNFLQFVTAVNILQGEKNTYSVYDAEEPEERSKVIGDSPAIQKVFSLLGSVSRTNATILITGESGVGKEVIADEIYRSSERKKQPFIKVNCASIPPALFESELFGYERGAFSGANSSGKKGLFEAADQGTLLLDEIGEMPLDMQAKLLRAIQESEITRVGGVKPIKLDIRYIAATNCSLKDKVREGTFRADLYYRLNVVPIHIPPLRERAGDVVLLSQHFLNMFNRQYRKHLVLSHDNLELLESYSWPGNIRELRNVIEYLVICSSDHEPIDNNLLCSTFDLQSPETMSGFSACGLNEALTAYEKRYLESALKYVRTLKEASGILNVDPSTVSRKLKQYGLTLGGKP